MAGDKGVVVGETLMEAEKWSAVIDHTPEIYAALWDSENQRPFDLWALVYDDPTAGTLMYPPLQLFAVNGDEEGLTLSGVGILHALGSGGIGPTEVDREYLSNANKLSNTLDPANPLDPPDLYWLTGGSIWVIGAGYATTSSGTEVYEDQPLICDEKFRAVPGATYHTTVTIGRVAGYSVGRLRLRHVYTGGPFLHADQLPAFSTWAASTGTSLGQHDITYDAGAGAFRCGPSAMPSLIPNGGFDDGSGSLNGFHQIAGNWFLGTDGYLGTHNVFTDTSAGGAWKEFVSSADGSVSGPVIPQNVIPAEEYKMWCVVRGAPGDDPDGEIFMMAGLTGVGTTAAFIETPHATFTPDGANSWRQLLVDITIPDNKTGLVPQIQVLHQTVGQWEADELRLIRTKGNLDFVTGPIFAITPGRSYRWVQPVNTDPGVREGTVSLAMVCFVATRPAVILQGPSVRVTGGAAEVIEWEFTPPSGMDVCMARIVCSDVVGGSVWLAQAGASIRQADTSSAVLEAIGPLTAPTNVALTLTSVAPAGSKDVHPEVVAEAYGLGWVASGLDLARVATPDTGAGIVADTLTDPTTHAPLAIGAGTITAPNPIPYDWRVIRMDRRSMLDHLCAVVSDPVLEYRVNAAIPPTIDVGPPVVVFVTHALADALLPSDQAVESLGNPETDTSERPTEVVVVGNDRTTVSGRPIPITATAQVPGPVRRDLNGRPVVRTRTVVDSTVDYVGYAQALADDLAEREAAPAIAVTVKLSGTEARGDVPPGDTIHVFHPESGLSDQDNAVTIDGRPAFPRSVRVLARERAIGPGHRIVMLRPDGTTFALAGVRWSDEDAVVLTVGDRLPEWVSDPQGKAEGVQYLDDRKSRPR